MNEKHASPPTSLDGPLIRGLATSIRYAVRILAALMALMVLVIWWGGGCGLRAVRTRLQPSELGSI